MKSILTGHYKFENDELRAIFEVEPLKTTWEVVKELNMDHSTVAWHLKKIRKVKKLDKWVPHELTKNYQKKKKIIILKCHLLLLYATTVNRFSLQLCHANKSGFYRTTRPAQWLDQEETPKHFQKPNLDTHTIRSWSLFGGLLPIWSSTTFWILVKPVVVSDKYAQQINKIQWKLQCLQSALVIGQKRPSSRQCQTTSHTTSASEVQWIGLGSFVSSAVFTWSLANWLPTLRASWQHFAWKTLP